MYQRFFKRFLDILFSGCTLVVLSPIFLVVAILVRINLGKPIIFCQLRPGKDEYPFKMYKFRSMADLRDKDGNLLPDKLRLTKFGEFLRQTSLDELPELWNILKGDMSIVGPRPLLVRYLPYYTKNEHHRHDVRPGLTGLAQVNGRNFLTWEEIFNYDLAYVHSISFLGDIRIILQTVQKAISRADIVDLSQEEVLENGQLQVRNRNGIRAVHDDLDLERADMYASGNRQ